MCCGGCERGGVESVCGFEGEGRWKGLVLGDKTKQKRDRADEVTAATAVKFRSTKTNGRKARPRSEAGEAKTYSRLEAASGASGDEVHQVSAVVGLSKVLLRLAERRVDGFV
jgi:hypothetical protein